MLPADGATRRHGPEEEDMSRLQAIGIAARVAAAFLALATLVALGTGAGR